MEKGAAGGSPLDTAADTILICGSVSFPCWRKRGTYNDNENGKRNC